MRNVSCAAMLLVAGLSAPASAQVALSNTVSVQNPATGAPRLTAPQRGDWLIYTFYYRNTGTERIQNYTINHPLVPTAEFIGEETGAPLMSVDKGLTFAPLANLRVRNADGSERLAQPRDITHLRWRIPTIIEPGGVGEVSYKAKLK